MVRYLTASESLEKLCETQPDRPIKYGLLKTMGGLGLGGLAAGCGFGCWTMRDMITDAYDGVELAIGIALEAIVGLIGLGCGGGSLYLLADGATSLGKPLGIYSRDGSTYYRNGGFTNKPSVSDKRFGKKVNPVESVGESSLNADDYIFVNGILVRDTDLKSERKTTMIYNAATKTSMPHTYTEYTSVLKGELKGTPLQVFTVTQDSDFAKSLAENKKGSAIYAMGSLDEDKSIDLEQFGDAFVK